MGSWTASSPEIKSYNDIPMIRHFKTCFMTFTGRVISILCRSRFQIHLASKELKLRGRLHGEFQPAHRAEISARAETRHVIDPLETYEKIDQAMNRRFFF